MVILSYFPVETAISEIMNFTPISNLNFGPWNVSFYRMVSGLSDSIIAWENVSEVCDM